MSNKSKPNVRKERGRRSLQQEVGLRREYEIICLGEPGGFSTRTVPTIRQAMCQVEILLETGATKIGIYASQLEAQPNEKLKHGE